MRIPRWYLIAAAILVCSAGLFLLSSRGPERRIADLLGQFDRAKKQPDPSSFAIADVRAAGELKRAILGRGITRLTYHVTLPKHARFHVSLALPAMPDVPPGRSVTFLVGVSDGHVYQTMRSVVLTTPRPPGDEPWRDVSISLEEYADLTVDLILDTHDGNSAGGASVAAWGAPMVLAR